MHSKGKSGLRAAAQAVFRARYEEVEALESVTEIGRGTKGPKVRLLLLCVPMTERATAASSSTVNIANVASNMRIKLKQVFAVSRLVDITHDGSFDATFNFGSSGMVSVSFESHIQREMFVAEVRKSQREISRGIPARVGRDVQAMVSESIGAAVDADAAARVEKLRQEKRRAFSSEEEVHLLRALRRNNFDDVKAFEQELLVHQKLAELESVEALVTSQASWAEVRSRITSAIIDVTEVEQRIEQYAKHLLAKKDVIQQIEHDNNTLHRKQQNLQLLYESLTELREQLSLPPATERLLLRLRTETKDLVGLFSEGQNAQMISDAMKRMQAVLYNENLEKDYPIAAVSQRRAFFIEQRKMIAQKSQIYIIALIEGFRDKYSAVRRVKGGGHSAITWEPHTELVQKLMSVSDIINVLARINVEGFTAALRAYRTSMQLVYTLKAKQFFRGVRTQSKKVGWSGPFLVGQHETAGVALTQRFETGAAGETPRRMWRTTPPSSAGPSPSRGLGLSSSKYDDRDGASTAGGGDGKQVTINVPDAQRPGIHLLEGGAVGAHGARSARSLLSGVTTTIRTLGGTSGGGCLRPDLAFAIALETSMEAILQEESVLRSCFGLGGGDQWESITDPAAIAASDEDLQKVELRLRESLSEIFAGDAMLLLAEGQLSDEPAAEARKLSLGAGTASRGAAPSLSSRDRREQFGNHLFFELAELTQYLMDRCDRIYSVPMLCMVKAYLRDGTRTAKSGFCREILEELKAILSSAMTQFIAEQTESIINCRRRYLVHPTPLLHCFARLPPLIQRMEAVHNTLSRDVVDHSDYAAIAQSIVDQAFDALDTVTNLRSAEKGSDVKLTLADSALRTVLFFVDGLETKPKSVKRGYIEQYRHHAFFCAMYLSLPQQNFAVELLRDRFEVSRAKRDRFEELYLTRIILLEHFPTFGLFALSAEDLSKIYSQEELKHHRALSIEAVRKVVGVMEKEIRSGITESAKRIKRHFLSTMVGQVTEEAFHRTLLHVTWHHFSTLLALKVAFVSRLLQWPVYKGIQLPIHEATVVDLLRAAS